MRLLLDQSGKPLPQRTQAWHDWRDGKDLPDGMPRISATAASVIAGRSPFKSPYRLWMEMAGHAPREQAGYAAAIGSKYEGLCRNLLEHRVGYRFADVCIESGKTFWVAASLDGYNRRRAGGAELKINSAANHELALNGIVADYYYDQIQWQFLASDNEIEKIAYFSTSFSDIVKQRINPETSCALVWVEPDLLRQKELFEKCSAFRQHLLSGLPPVDSEFAFAAQLWRTQKARIDAAQEDLAEAEKALGLLLPEDQKSISSAGITVERRETRGRVHPTAGMDFIRTIMMPEQVAVINEFIAHRESLLKELESMPEALQLAMQMVTPEQGKLVEEAIEKSRAPATRKLVIKPSKDGMMPKSLMAKITEAAPSVVVGEDSMVF